MKSMLIALFAAAICVSMHIPARAGEQQTTLKSLVDRTVRPLMRKEHIAGMAVGIVVNGKSYVFDYGVASRSTRAPVTGRTLFELGSVSKTLTATLASWAQVNHYLLLTDRVSTYLPQLRNTAFGNVTLLSLGTHTPGGLALQVPDGVTNTDELMGFLRQWRPRYTPGTVRTYNNPGIGMLGVITAKSMHGDFTALMQQQLFPALGMRSTFIDLPAAQLANYADGYTAHGKPIRMTNGMLYAEAYGVKTTAADMLRFLEANMNLLAIDPDLQRAIMLTHTGYFQAGRMTQDLIWEQYPYPVTLASLLAGNSATVIFGPTPARKLQPPLAPSSSVWLNKTGSTNGFGAYVALVPAQRVGIVLLANKNFPIPDRVTAAYNIVSALVHAR